MDLDIPVVLLIFNRPELTKKVFNIVANVKPRQLFIVADGPLKSGDIRLCEEARCIVNLINWDCEFKINFSDTNLGCCRRVSSGLDWVFSQVEEAIILEDDCVPDPSFFSFCQSLLNYYRHDERVWVISGNNFQNGQWRGDGSYYFSRYNHCWGWATWRRAWQNFQHELDSWPKLKDSGLLKSVLLDPVEYKYWSNIFERLYLENKPDSWAYRWTYSCWINNALSILPNVNLVSNIGFGENSTHTADPDSHLANIPAKELRGIIHPPFLIRDEKADQYTFDHTFNGIELRRSNRLFFRLRRKVLNLLSI
ncbi:hypothetical protein XM38_023860 [Halomicronema hongdechloris C2206]|uniref:Hemolytic protein HlpA-like protein n=1 Tax=Halomicronema hongdechloris C2206 TaxID=1641165 RepID=A0A1Z3HMA8_9CYAN|nr:hemolytic protein HlpA-like protein [Halomicronema hongdechloris]ASC71434.1 hypothetical protein XM38_023860 [Halomicronema hongdechloris C2206]